MAHHHWDHLSDLNPGISDLLGPLGTADTLACLNAWDQHLAKVLNFPFEARVAEQIRRGPVQVGDIVMIAGIAEIEDRYGLLAHVRIERRPYV